VPIQIGVPKETFPGEQRVAITPRSCERLQKDGMAVLIESSAGLPAGYSDEDYVAHRAQIVSRVELFRSAEVIVQVRSLGANPEAGRKDLKLFRRGQWNVGFGDPLAAPNEFAEMAPAGVSSFAMELIPRTTRAQSMDAMSSMAAVAGYQAALMAASALPKFFPVMTTAAGTIAPAKVFVLGAGVAGLQAIATAKRLGAVVSAYDLRPAVKEQVESVGAKFISLNVESGSSEDKGGYARAMDEHFYRRQREMLTAVLREHDVVITTAVVPGRKAPILITTDMVDAMPRGSLIVDVAAERGGNCELTLAGRTIVHRGVSILGPMNLPSTIPYHASQMYSANVVAFLKHLLRGDALTPNLTDEIVRETLVTYNGEIVNERVRDTMALVTVATPARRNGK
jgi:H+-translocating NAD(P) transhydrogenase subunit alpha